MKLAWTVLCLWGVTAMAAQQSRMARDMDFIQQMFEIGYAPAEWKAEHLGWHLADAMNTSRQELMSKPDPSVMDYRVALNKFFYSTADYHVSVQFESTEQATLPLQLKYIAGHYYIVWLNSDKLGSLSLHVGDEVLKLGGQDIGVVGDAIKISHNVPTTDQSLLDMMLTRRLGSLAMAVPRGPVEIVTRDANGGTQSRQLVWDYKPESVALLGRSTGPLPPAVLPPSHLTRLQMAAPVAEALAAVDKGSGNPFQMGAKRSFVPLLGTPIWMSEDTERFFAYIFMTPDHRLVGYIRIASYNGDLPEVQEFVKIINRMQATDALILDQINNPGGSIFYLYALASCLTTTPLRTPAHRMIVHPAMVAEAAQQVATLSAVTNDADAVNALGESVGGYPVNYQTAKFLADTQTFLISEWQAGHLLTAPHFMGIDQLQPHPAAHYGGKILALINELDFSGGDFFPAILQDNNRARTLGIRTAGAGGYITPLTFPNLLGVRRFVVTGSIAVRNNAGGTPIENLGVTPNTEYALSVEDIRGGYRGYAAKILAELADILK